jgi:hypothetical protein
MSRHFVSAMVWCSVVCLRVVRVLTNVARRPQRKHGLWHRLDYQVSSPRARGFHVNTLWGFLSCLIVFSTLTFAQSSNGPLNFGNNYFVRGDYVVGGAYFMNLNVANGYATGTITIPDVNPGITGTKFVPAGAEVVVAVLYWQTVEKTGVVPGQPGSGENGFFRPVFIGGPRTGYPITGVNLASQNTVSYSSGGCTATSTGKLVRTYRANVLGALPRDASGNILANGIYEVRLPSTGNSTPLTLGASLVLIYRVLSPKVPLNSIVIYDGAFGQNNASLIMTQTVQGFYDAAHSPVARLTHIVGAGKSNKFQNVSLNGNLLPPLYGSRNPAFPGWYGTWDNPTWTFDPNETYVKVPNPVQEDAASATTQVVPTTSNQGCVSWGAVIVSTTVKNSDGDGLLDAWKKTPLNYPNPGYCDAAVNEGVCTPGSPSWVDLPGAVLGTPQNPHKDVFVQLDYLCSQVTGGDSCTTGDGINYSFDPRSQTDPKDGKTAVQKVVAAYGAQGITLHVNPPPGTTNQPNVHAIPEPYCLDVSITDLCPFPNVPGTNVNKGVVGWVGGLYALKSQLIDPDDPTNLGDCTTSPPAADCVPRFQPAAAPSKHYVLFGHAVGQPKWKFQGGTLFSATQSGTMVTFTTLAPVGTLNVIGTDANKNPIYDPSCPNGRITVIGAATNPGLDGTYCVNHGFNPAGTSFTITTGNSMTASYTPATDPNLALVPGFTSTASGVSDVGGANSLITLGLWGNPALNGHTPDGSPASDGQTPSVIAGTFMHEFGHGNALAHGGPADLVAQGVQSLRSVLINCKTNYPSVMSYSRQVEGVIDYSGLPVLNLLDKSNPTGTLTGNTTVSWYVPWPIAYDNNNNPIGSPATSHCDGTQITNGAQMARVSRPASSFSWASINPKLSPSTDINFDGNLTEQLIAACDWCNLDLAQIGGTGANSSSSGKQFNGGGGQFNGGGGQFNGGGGQFNGGGGQFNGGGGQFNGGGGQFNGGGGQFNGGGEIDEAEVNSVTRSPQGTTAMEGASARTITLNWTAPFGQIGSYNVYRSLNGVQSFSRIATVSGNPPATTYTDNNVACNATGYQYFVTAVLSSTSTNPGQESSPSNTVSVTLPNGYLLTGCYTNIPTSPNTAPSIVLNDLSFGPSPAVQGSVVPITWTLQDDNTSDYGNPYVNNKLANSLYAIGPVSPNGCTTVTQGRTPLVVNGVAQSGTGTFNLNGNTFTFMWNTDAFCAGSYTFELDTDSSQSETTPSALQLQIDINDTDSTPHITTLSLPNGTAGVAYSNTLTEDGGTAPFTWTVTSGSLPPGISLSPSGTLSGTSCVPSSYTFTVKVTDSVGNSGTQQLMLLVLAAPVAQVNQPLAPESSAPAAAGFNLTVKGTGFDTCSKVQWSGSALATTFNSATQLTAAVPSSDVAASGTASISVTKTGSPSSNVDFFQITNPTATVFLSAAGAATGVGHNPNGLIAADLNGDGKLDLAIANGGDNTVSILLGNGDGTFTAQPVLDTGSVPYSLTAGDFNNDGKLDLAVTNFAGGGSSTVSIFIVNGDGSFQPAVSYSVGNGATSVVTGDFNGDGRLDLAVANQNDHTVSILMGKGDGTFQAAVPYQAGTVDVAAVAIGDFNGDGKLDLALTNPSSDTVSVLLGNGDGTFQAAVTYATGNSGDHPIAVNAADFNGDGKLDLAVTNLNARTVAILLGSGDGTFQPQVSYSTTGGAMIGPSAMTTGDFNGDGKVDLAITDQDDNSVSILVGNGDGTFTFQAPLEFTTGNFADGVAAGDFNGDGRLDVAVANYSDNTVSVMLQAPHVHLAPSPLAFGSVTTGTSSSASVVTLTNDGSAALTISNIAIGGANPGDFSQNNNCPMSSNTLAAGANCTINVTFTPTLTGARSATLSITDNAGDSPQTVTISGTGLPLPPTSLVANATSGSGMVSLTWTASTSNTVMGYNVYRSTTSGGPYTKVAPLVATPYTDTVASGTYYYVVTAVDASADESAHSNEAFATD